MLPVVEAAAHCQRRIGRLIPTRPPPAVVPTAGGAPERDPAGRDHSGRRSTLLTSASLPPRGPIAVLLDL